MGSNDFYGYEEARKLDKILSDLMEKYPLGEEENYREWWKLTRTIGSTLAIIEHGIKEFFIKKENPKGMS